MKVSPTLSKHSLQSSIVLVVLFFLAVNASSQPLLSVDNSITYRASADFSSTQGFRNWYYVYGSDAPMTFGANVWQGDETYLALWADGGHPGNFSAAIRRWSAPQNGSVRITGRAADQDTRCGIGVLVYIAQGPAILWQSEIANGNTDGVTFDLSTTVQTGDTIDFGIDRGTDHAWDCDSTYFDPTIVLKPFGAILPTSPPPPTPPSPGSAPSGSIANITVGPRQVVLSAEARAKSLYTWPDGNMGVLKSGTEYTFFAANSSSVGKAIGTLDDPVAFVSSTNIQNMKNNYHYVAGGPIYKDPGTDTLLMFYHAEKWLGGDPTRFWSLIGMAKSTNGGNSWTDLGEIIAPNVPFDNTTHEITGGTYAIVGEYFYVYFRDRLQSGGSNNLAVTRAKISDVISEAINNDNVTAWTKYQGGSWSQPGLGGTSSNLESRNPGSNYMTVSYNNYSGKYIIIIVGGTNWNLYAAESSDGINWSSRVQLENESGESYAPSIIGLGDEPWNSDQQFYIYYVYSIAGGFNRWSDAVVSRRLITLNENN